MAGGEHNHGLGAYLSMKLPPAAVEQLKTLAREDDRPTSSFARKLLLESLAQAGTGRDAQR